MSALLGLRLRRAALYRRFCPAAALALLLLALASPLAAQDFHVGLTFDANGRPQVFYDAVTANYYIPLAGDAVTNLATPADLALGHPPVGTLTDARAPLPATQFYRVRSVPLATPLDTDGDGIDDVYELQHPNVLDPLNPADAREDYDGDGFTNLEEYQHSSSLEGPVDTVSREFTVFYVPDSDYRKEAVSRELTVFYAPDSASNKEAVSREWTMFVLPKEPSGEAISREVMVENVRVP